MQGLMIQMMETQEKLQPPNEQLQETTTTSTLDYQRKESILPRRKAKVTLKKLIRGGPV